MPEKQAYDGATKYERVEEDLLDILNDALKAFSHVNACYTQGSSLTEDRAVKCKSHILQAAMRLQQEIRYNSEVDEYEEMWERWEGEDGFISRFYDTNLRDGMPGWMLQFQMDIQDAAWQLGYHRVGKFRAADPDTDEAKGAEVID